MADPLPDDLITQIDCFISMVPSGDTFYRAEARRFIVRARAALKARDEEIARLRSGIRHAHAANRDEEVERRLLAALGSEKSHDL